MIPGSPSAAVTARPYDRPIGPAGETRRVALAPRSVASTGGHRNPYTGDLGGPHPAADTAKLRVLVFASFDEMGAQSLTSQPLWASPRGPPVACLELRSTQVWVLKQSRHVRALRRKKKTSLFDNSRQPGFPTPAASVVDVARGACEQTPRGEHDGSCVFPGYVSTAGG